MSWREGELSIEGETFHYYRRGSGAPVLLAHGFGDNGRCWTRVAEALEAEFELIAYDARGHGLSGGDANPNAAGDLASVVRALELERPALIGHSMGASAVARAAAKAPGAFACAILEDPGWRSPDRAGAPRPPRPDYAAMSVDEIERAGRERNPGWHDVEFRDWAESKKQLRATGLPPTSPEAWRDDVRGLEGLPVLLVTGDNALGAIVTPETAAEAQRLCSTLDVVRLSAGHNIRREAFGPFVEAVRAFLRRHCRAP
ncbi:MAG TPA: alpha/beta hydrolase [Dehalococcoidia bacterium]|nr:alpha/beta hydrolase [Dehalococcoidia bacterium]